MCDRLSGKTSDGAKKVKHQPSTSQQLNAVGLKKKKRRPLSRSPRPFPFPPTSAHFSGRGLLTLERCPLQLSHNPHNALSPLFPRVCVQVCVSVGWGGGDFQWCCSGMAADINTDQSGHLSSAAHTHTQRQSHTNTHATMERETRKAYHQRNGQLESRKGERTGATAAGTAGTTINNSILCC